MAVQLGEAVAWDGSRVGEPRAWFILPLPCPGVWGRGVGGQGPGEQVERVTPRISREQELAGWNSLRLPGEGKGEEMRRARPLWSLPTMRAQTFPALGQGVCREGNWDLRRELDQRNSSLSQLPAVAEQALSQPPHGHPPQLT